MVQNRGLGAWRQLAELAHTGDKCFPVKKELSQYDAPALNSSVSPPERCETFGETLCARPPMLRGKPYGP